jgi:hypothetical protein
MAVAALAVVATGCHGPLSTNTMTVPAHCVMVSGPPSLMNPPSESTVSLEVTMTNSSWASAGARVTFEDLRISGVPFNGSWVAFASLTGMYPFLDQPELPSYFASYQPPRSAILGTSSLGQPYVPVTNLTGRIGTTATVDLMSVLVYGDIMGRPYFIQCVPTAGPSTRLASLTIVDGQGN